MTKNYVKCKILPELSRYLGKKRFVVEGLYYRPGACRRSNEVLDVDVDVEDETRELLSYLVMLTLMWFPVYPLLLLCPGVLG